MPSRDLPARPHLDHLKSEAKALRRAFLAGDAEAAQRVRAVLGDRPQLKPTEAQRVLAREYGFRSWAALRAHVRTARGGGDEAVTAFLRAVRAGSRDAAAAALAAHPEIATTSIHVAAALGSEAVVRHLADVEPSAVRSVAGRPPAEPLLWLCYSPFHGESDERDDALVATARALLDAGADPGTRDPEYGVPVLHGVTGHNDAPRVARVLLEAGAAPDDGESLFHAAERFHEASLELLLEYGADPNFTGEWGNTPLHFLLEHFDVEREPRVRQGLRWLLDHGADPEVRSGRLRETALHAAARRGQAPEIVRLLLERGADVHARRADGRTPWVLAERGGFGGLVALLESAGAEPGPLSPADRLMAACGRGDEAAARRYATPEALADLEDADRERLVEAARSGRLDVVRACLAAGFDVDTRDGIGATALHHASIAGRARVVRELLERGADFGIRDREHDSDPLGWACFGVDFIAAAGGDYGGCVHALLEAGARPTPEHRARDPAVTELLGRLRDG